METCNERRLRKLNTLCIAKGGHEAVASAAKLNPAYLWQILNKSARSRPKKDGSRSERALGEDAARAIEEAYGLGRGWFDNDGEEETMTPRELQLIGLFRELDESLQRVVLDNVRAVTEEHVRMLERARTVMPNPFRLVNGPKGGG